MANKVHTVPLQNGVDLNSDDIIMPPGYVRKAHNMIVTPKGGLKRVKGWNNPFVTQGYEYDRPLDQTYYDTSEWPSGPSDETSLTQQGGLLFALRGAEDNTGTYPLQLSHTYPYASGESGGDELNSIQPLGWYSGLYDIYTNDVTVAVTDYCYSHIEFQVSGSFFAPETEDFINFAPHTVCMTRQDDILWKGESWHIKHIDEHDPTYSQDFIDKWWTTALCYHKNRLIIGTGDGVVFISSIGDPFDYDTSQTSSRMTLNSEVTNIVSLVSDKIFISTMESIYLVDASDGDADQWVVQTLTDAAGAYPESAQRIGNDVYFANRGGITSLEATQKFGDFLGSRKSDAIEPFSFDNPTSPYPINSTKSFTMPSKSLYVYTQANRKLYDYDEGEDVNWRENPTWVAFFGDEGTSPDPMWTSIDTPEDGSMVRMFNAGGGESFWFVSSDATSACIKRYDDGWSQDGEEYTSYLTTHYDHLGSPFVDKTYRKIHLTTVQDSTYGVTNPALVLDIATSFDNGVNGIPNESQVTSSIRGANWGTDVWGDFIWGEGAWGTGEAFSPGQGQNLSVTIAHTSAETKPYTIKTISYIYENRRIDH